MSIFDLFKPKPTTHVVTPVVTDSNLFKALAIRQGMWVEVGNLVGIVTHAHPADNEVTVMLTDAEGLNDKAVRVARELVNQARHLSIPEPRRPTEDIARSLGYL